MAENKFYAVKKGRLTGIFNTWPECDQQVKGFPGAVFKGFPTEQAARAWLSGEPEFLSLFPDDAGTAKRPSAKPKPRTDSPSPAENEPPADYIVYTDGSCLRNPDGPGGYAAVIMSMQDGEIREIVGGEPSTTNNRMELRAGIEALRSLPSGVTVDFHTDSTYMKNGFTNNWLRNWKRNGWKTATGDPVKNQDLWRALDEAFSLRTVRFHWLPGHRGYRWNERCDELARSEAAKFL